MEKQTHDDGGSGDEIAEESHWNDGAYFHRQERILGGRDGGSGSSPTDERQPSSQLCTRAQHLESNNCRKEVY